MKMSLKEISGQTKIPVQVLRQMMEDGVFSVRMDEADQDFFKRFLPILHKRYFLRYCISQIKSTERETFIANAHLESKWERYMYTFMVNQYSAGNKLEIPVLANRVTEIFGFDLGEEHLEKLRRIRNSIYKMQSRKIKKLRHI